MRRQGCPFLYLHSGLGDTVPVIAKGAGLALGSLCRVVAASTPDLSARRAVGSPDKVGVPHRGISPGTCPPQGKLVCPLLWVLPLALWSPQGVMSSSVLRNCGQSPPQNPGESTQMLLVPVWGLEISAMLFPRVPKMTQTPS